LLISPSLTTGTTIRTTIITITPITGIAIRRNRTRCRQSRRRIRAVFRPLQGCPGKNGRGRSPSRRPADRHRPPPR
jgi:hypothetical protein